MESPRIGLAAGETEAAAQTSAMAATTILLRVLRRILKRDAYSIRSNRPTIGVAPGLACASTRNTICDDLNVAV